MPQCPQCGESHDRADASCRKPLAHSATPPDALVGHALGGVYRIQSAIARGAMGVVYLASHERLGRTVAVKLIQATHPTSASAERFRREALTLARLSHPNIVTVHDFGEDETAGSYLVMEFVDGPSLASEIARRTVFAPLDAAEIVAQIADALDAAHAQGIVHRDIKPANILLERNPRGEIVKVVDFGIAGLLGADVERSQGLTATGVILGTPLYLSPEQCNAEPVDGRTDVYALGCVAFELLTGRTPFSAPTLLGILTKHAGQAPPVPSSIADVPAAIDSVLLTALAKRPEDRFATAGEFARVLTEAVRSTADTHAEPLDRGRTVRTTVPRRGRASGNLPVSMTAFVGRDSEITELTARLATARLLTLAGIGGIGKTRLALEVAAASAGRFRDGVWFVDLSPIHDPADVPTTVAHALGVREEAGIPLETSLVAELRSRQSLLVVDNCEQLIEAAASIVTLILAGCPAVQILATSRETLGVTGETVRTISPLDLPPEDASSDDALNHAAASKLLLDRIRQHNPAFETTGRSAATIAQVCRRLDGIPLAIELAAARARVLSMDQILERLDNRFSLLRSSGRSTLPRQQTLRATIDWSYDLLTDAERMLFGRLAVFVGGWTLEAAESVCVDERLAADDVLDLLTRLVEKSLVVTEELPDGVRFGMLETIRQYAIEKLRTLDDEQALRARHAAWCVDRVESSRRGIQGPDAMALMRKLGREIDNFRAAMRRGLDPEGDFEAAVRVAAGLSRFWEFTARSHEAASWLVQMTDAGRELPVALRAELTRARAWNSRLCGELEASVEWARKAVALCADHGDTVGEGDAHMSLAVALQLLGAYDDAWKAGLDALAAHERSGQHSGFRSVYNQLGLMASDRCEFEEAETWLQRCRAIGIESGDDRFTMIAMLNLAIASLYSGDPAMARQRLAEARTYFDRFPDVVFSGRLKLLDGAVAAAHSEVDQAKRSIREALRIGRTVEDPITMINALEHYAEVFLLAGQPEITLRLIAAADSGRKVSAIKLPPSFGRIVDRFRNEARERLGAPEAEAASSSGAAMSLEEAVDYAIGL